MGASIVGASRHAVAGLEPQGTLQRLELQIHAFERYGAVVKRLPGACASEGLDHIHRVLQQLQHLQASVRLASGQSSGPALPVLPLAVPGASNCPRLSSPSPAGAQAILCLSGTA